VHGIWAAGFHHVMARSPFARILKPMSRLFLFFFSDRGQPRLTETADTVVHLYM